MYPCALCKIRGPADKMCKIICKISHHYEGVFQYKRLIYGVNSAFECFQKQIEKIIIGCNGSKNISDDILIWGSTQQEHNDNLEKVLLRLKESGLKVNKDK